MKKTLLIIVLIGLLFFIGYLLWKKYFKIYSPNECPKYIDCMPGPGFKGCNVPKGCENITEIVE